MKNNKFNIFLWVLQGLLCAMLIISGLMKLTQPLAELSAILPWVKDINPFLVRLLGLTDLLGATGIILPLALKRLPKLTLWAAGGIIGLMLSAIVFHVSRNEAPLIGFNIILLAIAVTVFWGRAKEIHA